MEKNDGSTLDETISLMSDGDLLKIYLQLLYIINFCNYTDFFHNDLTFANIMVSANVDKTVHPNTLVDRKKDLVLEPLTIRHNDNNLRCVIELKNTMIAQIIDYELSIVRSEHINRFPYELYRICQLYAEKGSENLKALNTHLGTYVTTKYSDYIEPGRGLYRKSPEYIDKYICTSDDLIIFNVVLFKSLMNLCAGNTDIIIKLLINDEDNSAKSVSDILSVFGLASTIELFFTPMAGGTKQTRIFSLSRYKKMMI